jgi:hypothetical protein
MIQVKFLKGIAGEGFSYAKGRVTYLHPDIARGFIKHGLAIEVSGEIEIQEKIGVKQDGNYSAFNDIQTENSTGNRTRKQHGGKTSPKGGRKHRK